MVGKEPVNKEKYEAIGKIAEAGIVANIKTVLENKDEILKLDFSEIEKLGRIIREGAVASNFCCNGF